MSIWFTIVITCWFCTLVAMPRKPCLGNEVADLVYARFLGRQQRLALIALTMTATAFLALIVTLPQRIDPDLRDLRTAQRTCGKLESLYDPTTCYEMQAGGIWVRKQYSPERGWYVTDIVSGPNAEQIHLNGQKIP